VTLLLKLWCTFSFNKCLCIIKNMFFYLCQHIWDVSFHSSNIYFETLFLCICCCFFYIFFGNVSGHDFATVSKWKKNNYHKNFAKRFVLYFFYSVLFTCRMNTCVILTHISSKPPVNIQTCTLPQHKSTILILLRQYCSYFLCNWEVNCLCPSYSC